MTKLIETNINNSVFFTGHRPNKIGGYNMKNPTMLKVKDKLLEAIKYMIENEGIDTFYSGGALGFDTAAFFCVHIMKKEYPHIKNIVAIPFKKQPIKWSNEQKYWYYKMLSIADKFTYVDMLDKYSTKEHLLPKSDKRYKPLGDFTNAKMQKRNMFMVDNAKIGISLFDGTEGGTLNCLKYAFKQKRKIYNIDINDNFTLKILNNLKINS